MLNIIDSQIIAHLCYHIDRVCRNELHLGNIANERDYVSNLGTHLRFPFGPFFTLRFAMARTLPQGLETTFGCDSIIIFKKQNKVKVGLFEAKWPRYFTKPTYKWDTLNTSQVSRFSSQIIKQRNWINSGAVIWEMFFNESKPGKVNFPFDTFGSNCLLHREANSYLIANKLPIKTLWNKADLFNVLPKSMNFRRMVYNILRCRLGKAFTIKNNSFILSFREEKIEIPVLGGDTITDRINTLILTFMEKNGLSNYISIDVNEIEIQ